MHHARLNLESTDQRTALHRSNTVPMPRPGAAIWLGHVLNRNLHLGHGQDCAGEAELGDLAGETVGLNLGCGAAEVVGAEVLVEGAVAEHVVGGGQD